MPDTIIKLNPFHDFVVYLPVHKATGGHGFIMVSATLNYFTISISSTSHFAPPNFSTMKRT